MVDVTQGLGITEQEIGAFWAKINMDNQFYYKEQLL